MNPEYTKKQWYRLFINVKFGYYLQALSFVDGM